MKKKKLSNSWKRLMTSFFVIWFSSLALFTQNITVNGTVVDQLNEPLIGVSVVVQGTTNGMVTNFDGNYTLSDVPSNGTIVFSYVGMKKQFVPVNGRTIIHIVLEEEGSVLDEIVVTGYTRQARSEMTTSIAKLDTKVLQSAPRSNAATALQGTIPGLKVTNTTGQPGSTPKMQLRGGTNWDGSGEPLILIDGVPSSFYALNADDIESMEVLKDAASTAIYGARAANGVVLVTTKSGTKGRTNVTFRARYTSNQHRADKMEYLSAEDYIHYNRIAIKDYRNLTGLQSDFESFLSGSAGMGTGNNITDSPYTTMYLTENNKFLENTPGWHVMTDPLDPTKKIVFQDNDISETIYQPSQAQDYSVSVDGGTDKSTYYLGLGYMDDTGLILNSHFKRISGTFNGSFNITNNLKISSNVIYANSSMTEPIADDRDIFSRFAGYPPTGRMYYSDPDGTITDNPHPGWQRGFGNLLYYQDKFIRDNMEQRFTGSVQLDYNFLENFNFMVRGSHCMINNTYEKFDKAYMHSGNLNTTRWASAEYLRTMRNQLTSTLNYRKSFNNAHNVMALVGTEYFKENRLTVRGETKNSPTDLIPTMNAGSEANAVPYSFRTQYAIASAFGQLNYDYMYKYLLGLTFRYDGTSRLGNNKWGFFPGVSLGWNVHNEEFFTDSDLKNVISNLKPRISYGVNGNIEVLSNFGVFGTYGTTTLYESLTGYRNNALPNLNLMWERSNTLNFGLDLGMFNNRITLIADYFIRNVNDKLAGLTLPLWTGFSSINTNNGTLQNRGLELALTADIVKTKDWNWKLGANYYSVRNYAVKLPDNGQEFNRQGGTLIWDESLGKEVWAGSLREGHRVDNDQIIAYVFDGVYKTQAEIDAHAGRQIAFATKGTGTKIELGTSKWKDLNGDNIINEKDRKVIGRYAPKFIGGVTSDLSYKNFNLFMKGDYAIGHMIINGRSVKGLAQTQGNQNGPIDIKNAWSPENPNSDLPRYYFTDPQKNYTAQGHDEGSQWYSSSMFWEKGDYFAMREITLSYNLSGQLLNNVISNARFFVTGANLFYLSGYSGSSPEEANYIGAQYGGVDRGRFPMPRTFTFGLNVSF